MYVHHIASSYFQAKLSEEIISTYLSQREKGLDSLEIAKTIFNVGHLY